VLDIVFRLGILLSLFSSLIGSRGLPGSRFAPWSQVGNSQQLTKTDRFGYQMSDTTNVDWVEATDGTKLVFGNLDDGSVGPVNIGFPFKFYENTYSQLYVSTNGFISFGVGSTSPSSRTIPWNSTPNNIIAPFWDDLYLGTIPERGVFTKLTGVTGSRKLVIEWYRVVRFGEWDLELTFEIILHEDGKIDFVYNKLDGTLTRCTVGIEDQDGLEGLQYVFNEPGLSVGKEIEFDRPAPSPRVKVLPHYLSGFVVDQRATFQLVVKNTGESGSDIYNLQAVASTPDWSATISKTGGQSLQDSSSDGIQDTGPLAVGDALTLSLQVSSPALASIGDYTTVVFTASSVAQSSVLVTATAQAAIPGAFVQVYFDASGVQLRQVWDENIVNQKLGVYTGQALAVSNISSDNYFVAWERRDTTLAFTDVVYQVVSRLGGLVQNPQVLTGSNGLLQLPVTRADAQNPVIARSASTGQIGVAWRQYLARSDGAYNSSIRLVVLNNSGVPISDRFNLINDTTFYSGTVNSHEYTSPFLTAGVNGQSQSRFFVCWVDIFRLNSNTGRKLTCGVFSFNGAQLLLENQFDLETVSGSTVLNEPFLTNLSGDRVLIVYTRSTGASSEIVYTVRSLEGALVKAPTSIPGASGDKVRAIQFLNNDLLMVWRTYTGELEYIVLDGSNYGLHPEDPNPKTLPNVQKRSAASLSVTLDQSGNAQLTWVDAEDNNYLYYLSLASDGSVVTPGMQFVFPILGTSTYGQGIASYLGVYQNFLPLLRK
jgi:hypothetical protein